MESQPQNLEFRIKPENFHPCILRLLMVHGHYKFMGLTPEGKPNKYILTPCADPGIFVRGGPGKADKKSSGNCFFF